MKHITKAHVRKAMKEHHMIGEMLGARQKVMGKAAHKKALEEHHFLGNLIGSISKMLGFSN